MNRSKIIIFTSIGLCLIGAIAASIFYYKKRADRRLTQKEYLELAEKAVDEKDFRTAYGHFVSASKFEGSPGLIHWKAARIAPHMGWNNEALTHGKATWSKGFKNANVIRFIFSLQSGFKSSQVKKALAMLDELEDGREKEILRGEIYAMSRNYDKALQYWKAQLKKKIDPVLINRIASTMLDSRKQKDAMVFLKHMERLGHLNEEGYTYLLSLLFETRQFALAEQILKKAQKNNYYGPLMSYKYGKYLFIAGLYQDADRYLSNVMQAPGIYPHDIKNTNDFINNIKRQINPFYKSIYSQLDDEIKTEVDQSHYLDQPNKSSLEKILRTTLKVMLTQALNKEERKVLTGPELYRINRQYLSSSMPEMFSKPKQTPLYYESKILLLYIHHYLKEQEKVEAFTIKNTTSTPLAESLSLYKSSLLASLKGDHKSALIDIKKTLKLIPDHPIFMLSLTDQLVALEKFDEALFIFQKLLRLNPSYHFNAMFNTKWAQTAMAKGDKKLALSIIARLHKLQVFSPSTLALYRDLSAELGKVDVGQQVQKLLSSQNKNPENNLWGKGILEYYRGNYQASSNIFEELKQKSPDTVDYGLAEMLSLLGQKQYPKVIQQLNNVKSLEVQHYIIQARAYAGMEDIEKATLAYQNAIKLKANPAVVKEMSYFLVSHQKTDKALTYLEKHIPEHRKDAEAYAMIAWIYKQKGSINEAKSIARKALDIDEFNLMAKMVVAEIEWNNNRINIALGQCDSILIRHKNYHPARYLAGLCYFKLGKYKKAQTYFRQVIEHMPNKRDLQYLISETEYQLKDFDSSIKSLSQLINDYPKLFLYQRRIMDVYVAKGDVNMAKQHFDKINKKLDEIDRVILQASILELEGKNKEATDLLFKYKDHRQTIMRWAYLHLKNNTFKGLDPSMKTDTLIKEDWINLGYSSELNQQYELTFTYYKKAMSMDPKDNIILSMFARISLRLDRLLPETTKKVKASMDAQPGNVYILDTYISILSKQKKYEPVIDLLERHGEAVLIKPSLKYYLAQAYENTFELEKALKYYNYAVTTKEESWDIPLSRAEIQNKIKYLEEQ